MIYILLLILLLLVLNYLRLKRPKKIWSKQSGQFSSPDTWVGGKVPGEGDSVGICEGHVISFDNEESVKLNQKEENEK